MSRKKQNDETEVLSKLFNLGYEGFALLDCSSDFEMDDEEFLEMFMANKSYRISYNAGKKQAKGEVLAKIKAGVQKGEVKAIEALLDLLNTKDTVQKSTVATTVEKKVTKKATGLEHLFDPTRMSLKVVEQKKD